jgi:lysozyme family protein
MKSSYPTAIKGVLAHEGGYTNHPADPGGPTNWGITIHDARMYWKSDASAADVKAMPLSVAQDIYKKRYWDAQRCDELPAGLDYSIFDYGVNSGIGRSGKVLRRVLGLPDNTSVVTQAVLDAVAKRDPKELIAAVNDERLRFLKALKTWPVFGTGWGRRVTEVRALSLALTQGKPALKATPTPGTETMAKAEVPPAPAKDAAKDAGKQGIFALIVAAIAASLAWVVDHPIVAIGGTVLLVGAVVFVWRWGWPAFKAWRERPSSYHDKLMADFDEAVASVPTATAALPSPGAVWTSTETTTTIKSARKKPAPRKPAAKPKAKKKSTKRKAA